MREMLKDFEAEAWAVLAQFRASADRHVGDPCFAEIVADVAESDPDFARRGEHHDVAGFKFLAAENPDLHLMARHPADPSTRRALDAVA
jgi:hypothetical protein